MIKTVLLNEEIKREYANGARGITTIVTKTNETEKAYEFTLDKKVFGYLNMKDSKTTLWIPKSQCQIIEFEKPHLILNDKYENIQEEFGDFTEQYIKKISFR
jgi:hypothetical protein